MLPDAWLSSCRSQGYQKVLKASSNKMLSALVRACGHGLLAIERPQHQLQGTHFRLIFKKPLLKNGQNFFQILVDLKPKITFIKKPWTSMKLLTGGLDH